MEKTANNRYLTGDEIAAILDTSRSAVFNWIEQDRLKVHRVGGKVRVYPEDLLAYLSSLGNSPEAMEMFREKIASFLALKYGGGDIEEAIRRIVRLQLKTGSVTDSDRSELKTLKQSLLMLLDGDVPAWMGRLAEITASEVTKHAGRKCNIDLTMYEDQDGKYIATVETRFEGGKHAGQ